MRIHRLLLIGSILLLQARPQAANRNTYPLPEERGTAGILGQLQRLPVYVHVLQTTAHPDDESAGTLTWLSRSAHARTALFALTRGEGGQNILGSERGDALGLIRTGELLEACRIYGVELYFSTAIDFGFSKNAEETLSKWGHEATLEEMVRLIRMWRPTIIISRFQGNPSDGHGHHQAAGIITREAFRAAGDAHEFPEQFQLGLYPWQAKKLYTSRGRADGNSPANMAAEGIVRIPVGDYDPVLGRSCREIGSEGYSKHRSQGNGAVYALPGPAYDSFTLVDSTAGGETRDPGIFDSIDTSLSAITLLAGEGRSSVPFLTDDLVAAQSAASEALEHFQPGHPASSADAVIKGAARLAGSIRKLEKSSLPHDTKSIMEDALKEKLADFQDAANAVLGIYLVAEAGNVTAVPGEKLPVTLHFYNRGTETIDLTQLTIESPVGEARCPANNSPMGEIAAGAGKTLECTVTIAPGAEATEPFWYRENKEDARYKVRPTSNKFAPFGPSVITAKATYRYHGTDLTLLEPVRAQAGDPIRGSDFIEVQIVPALSVSLVPDIGIAPFSGVAQTRPFQVSVLNNEKDGSRGVCKLVAPSGWQVEPPEVKFDLSRKQEISTAKIAVHIPAKASPGAYTLEAIATAGGKEFRRGYQVISYPENWTRNLYSPSRSDLKVFDIKVPPDLSVGYITGSGDDVPTALEQLGVKVQMLGGPDLAFGDLRRFSAIVTGVRAYNVNEDLRANNQRLLHYVEQGGTLIVQYNRVFGRGAESPFPYGPYPMSDSDADRITVEDSPVRILKPENAIFNTPNKITPADFQGWVQERGSYFMHSWDSRYTPLLSGNDPGEKPLSGGMLVTRYGKGYYIYTAYAWFRQLPAGVPGAFRIFVNLLSLGRQ